MSDGTTLAMAQTAGIDVGDRYSHFEVVGADGETVAQGRFRTTPEGLERTFRSYEPMRIAFETGTHVHWMKEVLERLGHEVIVANARKVELIWKNDRKSDERDPAFLARLARVDPQLLAPVTLREREAQNDLSVIRARDNLVAARTQLINSARGLVKASGGRLPSCSAESFHKKAAGHVPEAVTPAVAPLLQTIEHLTAQIRGYDKKIEALAETKYPVTKLLRQVRGVGPITALVYVLVLANPRRFKKSRLVGAFVGLVPRRDQSGKRDPELRIAKAGNDLLRRLLVQSAHYILGHFGEDCDLRRFGLKLAARGGKVAKRRAVVAVARKLAVLLHRIWVTGEVYEALRNAKPATTR